MALAQNAIVFPRAPLPICSAKKRYGRGKVLGAPGVDDGCRSNIIFDCSSAAKRIICIEANGEEMVLVAE